MAKARGNSNNGAASAPEQTTPEAQPEQATREPHDDGAAEVPLEAAPQDEPGPEDFGCHTGARLISEHAADLALLAKVERRIRARENEIATRTRTKGGPNAIVTIGGKQYIPRQRPARSGGGMLLAEVGARSEASLD